MEQMEIENQNRMDQMAMQTSSQNLAEMNKAFRENEKLTESLWDMFSENKSMNYSRSQRIGGMILPGTASKKSVKLAQTYKRQLETLS